MLIVDAQVHIWANNTPPNPNHRQVATFSEEQPWLSARDTERIMGRALCMGLGWSLPRSSGETAR